MLDATYTNDEYGFTFMYPGNWIPADKSGAMVFAIAASSFQGADSVNASVVRQVPATLRKLISAKPLKLLMMRARD
jgi:hypothetical protein